MSPDPDEEWSELREAADEGDPAAMVSLGRLVLPEDPSTALGWFERAAALGSTDAMFFLGWMLSVVDPAASARWYREAASRGSRNAAFNLGLVLERSHPEIALEYFDMAAQRGHPRALRHVALIRMRDDPVEGRRLLKQAVQQGDTRASQLERVMRLLGPLYGPSERLIQRMWPWFGKRTHRSPDGRVFYVTMSRRFPRPGWQVAATAVGPGTRGRNTTNIVADHVSSKQQAKLEVAAAVDAIRTGRNLKL